MSKRLEYGLGSAPRLNSEERERRRRAVVAVNDALLEATLTSREFAAFAIDGGGDGGRHWHGPEQGLYK